MSYTEIELQVKHENLSSIYLGKVWNKMMKVQNMIRGQTGKSQHKIVLKTEKEMGTS
jgi:hypothetical protein